MPRRQAGCSAGVIDLHTRDDYQSFTVRVIHRGKPSIGRTFLRPASPQALGRQIARIRDARLQRGADTSIPVLGPVHLINDPDGHPLGWYWDIDWYRVDQSGSPAFENQPAEFPGRGANIRRIDQGAPTAIWFNFGNKTQDPAHTLDWAGPRGRSHHVEFATDAREDILRAADVFLEAGTHIETGPQKRSIQQKTLLSV